MLERGRVGQTWRGRWDSFCLVTPNWTVQLPGHPYDGDDPDGFMPRDEIVGVPGALRGGLRRAGARGRRGHRARAHDRRRLPARHLGRRDRAGPSSSARAPTSGRTARPGAATLPAELLQIDVEDYRNPAELPPGAVLVVGSGQSGCQIAEELHEAGRDVLPRLRPRGVGAAAVRGHDLVWWLMETGFLDDRVEAPCPSRRRGCAANVQATGHGGGHDLHYRTLHAMGVTLLGHFLGADGRRRPLRADLAREHRLGRRAPRRIMGAVSEARRRARGPEPDLPEPRAVRRRRRPSSSTSTGFGAVVFTAGFRPDYASWVDFPGAFDALGFPLHRRRREHGGPGGLYFAGVHFLRKRKSSLLFGVGEDAAIVARQIAER